MFTDFDNTLIIIFQVHGFFKSVNNGTGLVKDANFDGKQIPTFSVKRRLMLVCSLKVTCKGFFRTHNCFIPFIITSSK